MDPMLPIVLAAAIAGVPSAPASVAEAADGYCAYVTGVADAESLLMLSPELFATAGLVRGSLQTGDEHSILPPTSRITAGLQYSATRLFQGLETRKLAVAECRRNRAKETLLDHLRGAIDSGQREGLLAREAVLKEAMPRAEEIVGRLEQQVAEGLATVEELSATQLRIEAMRASIAEGIRERAALSAAPLVSRADVARLREEHDVADAEVERISGTLRSIAAWDVSVRGGYDRILGAPDQFPVFGLLSVSYNLGGLFQGEANRRAAEGRKKWIDHQAEGVAEQASGITRQIEELLAVDEGRLQELAMLRADLEGRLRAAESIPGPHVRRFTEYVWFELTRTRAEEAYQQARVTTLRAFLASGT